MHGGCFHDYNGVRMYSTVEKIKRRGGGSATLLIIFMLTIITSIILFTLCLIVSQQCEDFLLISVD
jgi:hypothetical protein